MPRRFLILFPRAELRGWSAVTPGGEKWAVHPHSSALGWNLENRLGIVVCINQETIHGKFQLSTIPQMGCRWGRSVLGGASFSKLGTSVMMVNVGGIEDLLENTLDVEFDKVILALLSKASSSDSESSDVFFLFLRAFNVSSSSSAAPSPLLPTLKRSLLLLFPTPPLLLPPLPQLLPPLPLWCFSLFLFLLSSFFSCFSFLETFL